ncbi:MAG: DMT family transporter [Lachnospiraceae bacterium]|jgi:drug/metabolite transporter (DMT)-like permease|nr:DMT family transporter [Lachnospiraceae bacterium]
MKNKKEKNILIGCICAIVCQFLFGMSFIFTKQVVDKVSPFALLGWRFIAAFIVMTICIAIGALKINLNGKKMKPLIVIGIFSPVVYFVGETLGIKLTTASESGTVVACIPVVSLVASSIILKEKPKRKQVIGIIVTLIGAVITVFAVEIRASFSLVGYLLLIVAVVSYAFYSAYSEKASEYTSTEITYVMMALGALFFGTIAIIQAMINGKLKELITLPINNRDFLITTLYLGIGCSVVAFFLVNIALAKIGVNRVSTFVGIATVVSILSGVIFLHEAFSRMQIIGAVIIVAGVYIANIKRRSLSKNNLEKNNG